MAQTQLILLQRVENLGQMGDVVTVKPGFARNYLLPMKKALRASKSNVAYFESQKKQLETENLKHKSEAEKVATKMGDFMVTILRQAAEGGQLYGSVSARDIADAASANGVTFDRSQIRINQAFKTLGLFPVDVFLHAEVKVIVTINIARSEEEAKLQKKLGRAIVADAQGNVNLTTPTAPVVTDKAAFLDEAALSAEQQAEAQAQADAVANAGATAEKSAKRAAKKAIKKSDDVSSSDDADAADKDAE